MHIVMTGPEGETTQPGFPQTKQYSWEDDFPLLKAKEAVTGHWIKS